MDTGLFIAASGMVAEQTRQDQLSNDLANASTPGYKPDEAPQHNFGEMLLANTQTGQAIGSMSTGVQLGASATDLTQASVADTGQPLDFALTGSGFFSVQTTQGVRYTRNGQFSTNAQGELVDGSGNKVLNQQGAAIRVQADGHVPASALGVFDLSGAAKQGNNLFTGKPTASANPSVRQGALEQSGVDAAKVMVDMISSMRAFQSGQQAIQSIDQTLQEAATRVGTVTGS
ncbi:MAG TPA: flagellar hook-basal body protein [Solirubrobacteraceae bacterium]|nr:flagellar hook-basal body protein [Solirubrobacteraceae bacterium]